MAPIGINIFCLIGIVAVVSGNTLKETLLRADIAAKITESPIDEPDIKTPPKEQTDTRCAFGQTMAWNECGKKLDCPTSCTTEDDCTFPYCNMLKQCQCEKISGNTLKETLLRADIAAKITESPIDEPDITTPPKEQTDTSCAFGQTMAWNECGKKLDCPTSCTTEDDCTFPYCNMLKQCQCEKTFCHNAQMCYFFRIDCSGNFTCVDGSCRCG